MQRKNLDPLAPHRPPPDYTPPASRLAIDLPPPIYDRQHDTALWQEQQVMRCEALMVQGIRARPTLMKRLEVDGRTLDALVKRVHARWEMVGLSQDHARHRGEGEARLDMVEAKLWAQLETMTLPPVGWPPKDMPDAVWPAADPRACIAVLKTIAEIQAQRSELQGLTAKVIERLGSSNSAAAVAFAARVSHHEQMSRLAARMLDRLQGQSPAVPTLVNPSALGPALAMAEGLADRLAPIDHAPATPAGEAAATMPEALQEAPAHGPARARGEQAAASVEPAMPHPAKAAPVAKARGPGKAGRADVAG